jgi:tetratricopeptide (TPR) repeat protein
MSHADQRTDRRENIGPDSIVGAAFGRKDWLLAATLVVAVFLVYQPAWHGGFLWDDDTHLLNNPVLKPGGLAKIWVPGDYINYWPLTFTAYWLQFHLWGLQPLGYHLVNLALHALSALLVWQILVRLRVPGAMFAAAIFALHPVNVESVAWIAQFKGILSLLLALASVLFYLDHERHGGSWRYALAIAAFLLSALAKGAALTLPIVLLSLAWWQRRRIAWRDFLRVVPYVLIGAVMAGVETWGQHLVSHWGTVRSDGFFSRAAVAGCAVWFYLGKLIWPFDLCLVYPPWQIDGRSVLPYLPGAMLVALLALAWWRRRTWGRPIVMMVVCYVGLLLPILGFVNIYAMRYSLVADHWQYAAMIVPCAVFAGASATLAQWLLCRPKISLVFCMGPLLIMGCLTWGQSQMYAGAETLYQTTLARNPACWLAYNNLGQILAGRGRVDEAITHYRKALEINPDDAEAQNNLGVALVGRGRIDEAISHYQKAVEIKPDYAAALSNLGNALAGRRRIGEAVARFQNALEIKPDFAEAHCGLGNALASRGQLDEAMIEYQKALEIKPDYAEAHNNLGGVLAVRGRADEAIAHYQRAIEIQPDFAEARNNLGIALFDRGRFDEAILHDEKALKIRPDFAEAHNSLGNALAGRGEFDSAIAHYQKALEIKPDYVDARRNLALALSKREAILKTLTEQRESLRLRPNDAVLLNDTAWTLATNPNESIRNGSEAVKMAERSLRISGGNNPSILGTLSAAYAEANRFHEAVRTGEKAVRLAAAAGDRTLAEKIRTRLELYRNGKPYRQVPGR